MSERRSRTALRRLVLFGGVAATLAYVLASPETRTRAMTALRRAWRVVRPAAQPPVRDSGPVQGAWRNREVPSADTEKPEPVHVQPEPVHVQPEPVQVEPVPAHVEPEPLPEALVQAAEPATTVTEHELDGVRVQLPEPEEVEPEVVEAVEDLAGEPVQEPGPAPLPRAHRRWATVAAVAALLCGAGALAAVSWAVWGSDLGDGNGESQEATPTAPGAAILAAVSRPTAKRIPVAGSKGKVILVVARDGRAALIVSDLSRAPKGKQFEAWVIVGSTPKRAGLFSGGPGYVVVPLTRAVPKGATVAVTLERTGGVDAPTTTPLFATKRG